MVERIRYLVLAAQREGNRCLCAELSALEVTPAQSEVLRVLADHGPLTLSGVGERLVCESGTNPSSRVGRLVEVGLIRRDPVPGDARQVRFSLTAGGRAKAANTAEVETRLPARASATHSRVRTPNRSWPRWNRWCRARRPGKRSRAGRRCATPTHRDRAQHEGEPGS